MLARLIAFATCFCASFGAVAGERDVVLICDAPAGKRVDYGNFLDIEGRTISSTADGPIMSDDRFSNIRPAFVWRQARPKEVLIWWGNTVIDELLAMPEAQRDAIVPPPTSRPATVVYRDRNQIQAVELQCGTVSCTLSTYAIFPHLSFMTRTDSSFSEGFARPGEGSASSRLFWAKCSSP